MGVNIAVVAPVFGHSSYSFVAREIILELDSRGHDVDVVPMTTPQDEDYVDEDIREVATLINTSRPPAPICSDADARLAVTTPTMASTMEESGLPPEEFVLHTVWETDRLPWEWAREAEKFEAVVTSTEFCKDAIGYHGNVDVADLTVPQPIDSSLFTPYSRDASRDTVDFLTVIDVTPRKGLEFLLDAYVNTLADRDDCSLTIKGWSSYGDLNEPKLMGMAAAIKERTGANINVITSKLSPTEMRDLYRGHHAFVLPTRGEGWGRPAVEALACGCYPVVTGWSAPMEVLPMGCWRPIDYDLVEVEEDRQFGDYAPPQQWALPDTRDLSHTLLDIADNYHDSNHYKKSARKGSRMVREHWTEAKMGRRLEDVLSEVF